jgi:hypothetical protein
MIAFCGTTSEPPKDRPTLRISQPLFCLVTKMLQSGAIHYRRNRLSVVRNGAERGVQTCGVPERLALAKTQLPAVGLGGLGDALGAAGLAPPLAAWIFARTSLIFC